jgi:hypothetical protein|tara:strand:- start:2685 stop:3047 length:363 start_codon:yes stop_codon:yes gene_type:complete
MKGWPKYFQSIQDVCPWSYQAYKEGKLDIREFDIDAIIDEDWDWTGRLNAIVWQNVPYSLNDLEALVTDLNRESKNCIYFFSHPAYTKGKNKQTLVPVIIQQDKEQLTKARRSMKGRKKP